MARPTWSGSAGSAASRTRSVRRTPLSATRLPTRLLTLALSRLRSADFDKSLDQTKAVYTFEQAENQEFGAIAVLECRGCEIVAFDPKVSRGACPGWARFSLHVTGYRRGVHQAAGTVLILFVFVCVAGNVAVCGRGERDQVRRGRALQRRARVDRVRREGASQPARRSSHLWHRSTQTTGRPIDGRIRFRADLWLVIAGERGREHHGVREQDRAGLRHATKSCNALIRHKSIPGPLQEAPAWSDPSRARAARRASAELRP